MRGNVFCPLYVLNKCSWKEGKRIRRKKMRMIESWGWDGKKEDRRRETEERNTLKNKTKDLSDQNIREGVILIMMYSSSYSKTRGIAFDFPNIKYNIHSSLCAEAGIDTHALYLTRWVNKFYTSPIAPNHPFKTWWHEIKWSLF